MREVPEVDGSVTTDKSVGSEDEGTNQSANMSTDRSKDESDLSDYGEENTTCQLANHAVRARLLSSVVNSATVNDSKLRVSVFDHRTIPKKFIIPKKLESRPSVSCLDSVGAGDMNIRPQHLNGLNVKIGENGVRKGSTLSYTVLKANRRYNGDSGSTSSKSSPTSPLDSENDVRTSIDVLLRNLIGDVNDLNVQTNPTPVAFSSGYESDYPQTKDIQFNKTKSGSSNSLKSEQNKTDCVNIANNVRIGYYSEEPNAVSNVRSLQDSHSFSSLPSFPTTQSEPTAGFLKRSDTKEVPLLTLAAKGIEADQQGFSYAQRHNYKLTKVTRSMYEIIHDLQTSEKGAMESRKRARKGRRSSQEINNYVENGNASFKDNKQRGRLVTDKGLAGNKAEPSVTMKHCDSAPTVFSGAVVRCVRRPLGNDGSQPQRIFSQIENSNKLTGSLANKCGNKVQNDLRNLLCDTSTVTLSIGENNDHWLDLNSTKGGHKTLFESSSVADSTFNQTSLSLANESSANSGQRRPTLTEQFHKRVKPDDHVYETIPGDEKLYEEWKRARDNQKIPKIRRFTTIPDLPGTFIPKEPPALPERNYIHTNSYQPQAKDRDSYICMGDVNSNFHTKDNLNISKPGTVFMNLPTDTVLFESSFFQCYPLPVDISPQRNTGRTDETSDGYCSIDNLSLLRESTHETSFPETPPRDRISSQNHNFLRPRTDLFLSPMSADELNDSKTSREQFRNEIPRLLSRQTSRDEDIRLTFREPANFESYREQSKPVFQATYV